MAEEVGEPAQQPRGEPPERGGTAAGPRVHRAVPERAVTGLGDAALGKDVAAGIAHPLPGRDGRETGRIERGGVPLQRGEIVGTGEADPAVAPLLIAGPFHDGGAVERGPAEQQSGTSAAGVVTAHVRDDEDVTARNPVGGVGRFEGGAVADLEIADVVAGFGEFVEVDGITVDTGVLAVGGDGDQHGAALLRTGAGRAVDVGSQYGAVARPDGHVALDEDVVRQPVDDDVVVP